MENRKGVPLNIGLFEAITRLILIIPAGGLAVLGVIFLHTYILVLLPSYLIATALTYYSPVKHLFRLAMHRPVFTGNNDPVLTSEVI